MSKEFWINKGSYRGDTSDEAFYSCVMNSTEFAAYPWDYDKKNFTHVVEYSALDAAIARIEKLRAALEVISSNGEGRGMGWTPAQHSRTALAEDAQNDCEHGMTYIDCEICNVHPSYAKK